MSDARVAELYQAFLAELSAVTGAILEAPASVAAADAPPGAGWTVTLKASDGARGELRLAVDRAGAEALSKRASGSEVQPDEAAVVRTLTEICGASSTSFLQRMALIAARLVVASVQPSSDGPAAATSSFAIVAGDWTMRVAIDGDIEAEIAGEAPVDSAGPKLDVILDIDLPLVVRFGRTEMSLKALTGLGPGSVIDLERSPEDPVEVFVSNQLVARGEVVIVGGSYGVRITEVRDAAERVRSLEVEW
jgi:flagellar motor switch protein FliN